MKKRILCTILCLILALSLLPATALAARVTRVDIEFTVPKLGEMPDYMAWGDAEPSHIVRNVSIGWIKQTAADYEAGRYDKYEDVKEPFQEGYYYIALISVCPAEGDVFFSDVKIVINGNENITPDGLYIDPEGIELECVFTVSKEEEPEEEQEIAPNVFPVVTPAEEEPVTDVDEGTDEEEVIEDDEAVEEIVDEEPDEAEPVEKEEEPAPKTGDISARLWLALTFAAAGLAAAAAALKKRKNA